MGNSQATMQSEEERRRNIKRMDEQMNQRFGRSVKHKMTVIVRGDKHTGKTTLSRMLSGGWFDEEYKPTKANAKEKICVQWAAGPGEDVELTLITANDSDRKSNQEGESGDGLKIAHEEKNKYTSTIKKKRDAERVKEDAKLYEGAHGVIIMVNPCKEWTFSYAKDVIPGIPKHMEILIVGNYRDLESQWVTQKLAMQQVIAGMGRHTHFCETSLQNMFGMPAVESFLNIVLSTRKVLLYENEIDEAVEGVDKALESLEEKAQKQDYEAHVLAMNEAALLSDTGGTRQASSPGEAPGAGHLCLDTKIIARPATSHSAPGDALMHEELKSPEGDFYSDGEDDTGKDASDAFWDDGADDDLAPKETPTKASAEKAKDASLKFGVPAGWVDSPGSAKGTPPSEDGHQGSFDRRETTPKKEKKESKDKKHKEAKDKKKSKKSKD